MEKFIIGFILLIFILIFIAHLKVEDYKKKKTKELELLSINSRKKEIVFIGDSLTDFYQLNNFFPKTFIYNRGVAGDTTLNIIKRLEKTIYPLEPSEVFINIGTNDLMYLRKIKNIVSNIKLIVEKLKNNNPNLKVNIISLYPVNRYKNIFSFIFVNFRNNNNIIKINNELENFCLLEDLTYINLHKHLKNKKNRLKREYTIEGLHISSKGYFKITSVLKNYIKED